MLALIGFCVAFLIASSVLGGGDSCSANGCGCLLTVLLLIVGIMVIVKLL